jgi:hypothetical protein
MAVSDDLKGWVKDHTQKLRDDPKAWARERGQQLKELVDVTPFSDDAVQRELQALKDRVSKRADLNADERQRLHDDLLSFHDRLTPGGAAVSGAKIGLAASVLPVVGLISGPLLGSAYGVYRSQTLTEAREAVQVMLRELARG